MCILESIYKRIIGLQIFSCLHNLGRTDMKRSILLAIMASGFAFSTSAQEQQTPPTAQQQAAATPENAVENVIVTAPRLRSERALNNFVTTHVAATPFLGKIARWKTGICPITVGLPPKLNVYISQRILR